MDSFAPTVQERGGGNRHRQVDEFPAGLPELAEAEAALLELATVFFSTTITSGARDHPEATASSSLADPASNLEAKYRALLEQIPAVVFMAYLDRGISEA